MDIINLCFTDVTFSYGVSQRPVIKNLTVTFQKGWTGIIGANGIGKTTLAKLACGLLLPDKGSVILTDKNASGLYCEQETHYPPGDIKEFFLDEDNYPGKLRSILGIEESWTERWDTLSFGERKKLQVAAALWKNPEIIVLDEPTNHLDESTNKSVIESLHTYEGTGLIISHNRDLLDELCGWCFFMDTHGAVIRKGGVTEGLAQQEIEERQKEKAFENAQENFRKLDKSSASMKHEISLKRKSLSKKNLDKHDHDGKGRIDGLRLKGKDAIGARKLKNLQSRAAKAKDEMEKSYFRKRNIDGFSLNGERAERNYFLAQEEGDLKFKNGITLGVPFLTIKPDDKIGISGENGTGKSTLIKYFLEKINIPPEKLIYIPQEINPGDIDGMRNRIDSLNNAELGKLLTVIYRLGSEPLRVMETERPSPGEVRKILLGLGLLKSPQIIIMDEPTNHMDLPSVICLEKALKEFKGALVLVSHDRVFLNKVTNTIWLIENRKGRRTLKITHRMNL